MSSTIVQKLMRKTRRSNFNAEFYVIELTPAATQPIDFHTGEDLTTYQRDNFRSLLYDDFPELRQPVNSPHGSLRLCIDYRGLNEVTRRDAYPLPRVDDTLDELKDANFYTHLDLASSFWQVRVRDKDIQKTAFHP
jgi:hypothetical protein